MPKPGSEESIDHLPEGDGAVRYLMLGLGVHLAKALAPALGQEHRIIAESASAAWRPDKPPVHLACKILDMAVRPGDREHADEVRPPLLRSRRATGLQFLFDIAHGEREILSRSRPAG